MDFKFASEIIPFFIRRDNGEITLNYTDLSLINSDAKSKAEDLDIKPIPKDYMEFKEIENHKDKPFEFLIEFLTQRFPEVKFDEKNEGYLFKVSKSETLLVINAVKFQIEEYATYIKQKYATYIKQNIQYLLEFTPISITLYGGIPTIDEDIITYSLYSEKKEKAVQGGKKTKSRIINNKLNSNMNRLIYTDTELNPSLMLFPLSNMEYNIHYPLKGYTRKGTQISIKGEKGALVELVARRKIFESKETKEKFFPREECVEAKCIHLIKHPIISNLPKELKQEEWECEFGLFPTNKLVQFKQKEKEKEFDIDISKALREGVYCTEYETAFDDTELQKLNEKVRKFIPLIEEKEAEIKSIAFIPLEHKEIITTAKFNEFYFSELLTLNEKLQHSKKEDDEEEETESEIEEQLQELKTNMIVLENMKRKEEKTKKREKLEAKIASLKDTLIFTHENYIKELDAKIANLKRFNYIQSKIIKGYNKEVKNPLSINDLKSDMLIYVLDSKEEVHSKGYKSIESKYLNIGRVASEDYNLKTYRIYLKDFYVITIYKVMETHKKANKKVLNLSNGTEITLLNNKNRDYAFYSLSIDPKVQIKTLTETLKDYYILLFWLYAQNLSEGLDTSNKKLLRYLEKEHKGIYEMIGKTIKHFIEMGWESASFDLTKLTLGETITYFFEKGKFGDIERGQLNKWLINLFYDAPILTLDQKLFIKESPITLKLDVENKRVEYYWKDQKLTETFAISPRNFQAGLSNAEKRLNQLLTQKPSEFQAIPREKEPIVPKGRGRTSKIQGELKEGFFETADFSYMLQFKGDKILIFQINKKTDLLRTKEYDSPQEVFDFLKRKKVSLTQITKDAILQAKFDKKLNRV